MTFCEWSVELWRLILQRSGATSCCKIHATKEELKATDSAPGTNAILDSKIEYEAGLSPEATADALLGKNFKLYRELLEIQFGRVRSESIGLSTPTPVGTREEGGPTHAPSAAAEERCRSEVQASRPQVPPTEMTCI